MPKPKTPQLMLVSETYRAIETLQGLLLDVARNSTDIDRSEIENATEKANELELLIGSWPDPAVPLVELSNARSECF